MGVNAEIKALMREKGVRQWQVAEALGMSEATITRTLRRDLSPEMKNRMIQAINTIVSESAQAKIQSAGSRFVVEKRSLESHKERTVKRMLKSEAYQQIERIAQERGVSMDRVAAHLGMHNWELDQIIAHSMSALAWAKITSAIQALSPSKGVIKAMNPYGKIIVENTGYITDCTE